MSAQTARQPFQLPVNAYRTRHELVIVASVPGLEPQDIDLALERGQLTIRGEIPPPLGNVDYLLQEMPYGPFEKRLRLGLNVEPTGIEATVKNGILTVCLPLTVEHTARVIPVHSATDAGASTVDSETA